MRASGRLFFSFSWVLSFAPLMVFCIPVARAAEPTDLVSVFEAQSLFNVDLRVGYQRTLKRGAIKREYAGLNTSQIETVKDLRFSQVRHILNIRNDYTLLRAIQFYLEFPIILSDTRWLDFAQNGGDPCIDTRGELQCVNRLNSTVVRDQLAGTGITDNAQIALAGPDPIGGGLLLPTRSGLDQIKIGLSGAPLSQQRDDTKPTWVIGFEARIAVGDPMEYDPANPTANTSVSRGVHQFEWWTAVSHRFRYVDPWISFFYSFSAAKGDSLFEKTTFDLSGQERSGPQQRGGTEVGLGIIPWEDTKQSHKVTIELAARLEGVFEGRDYSEMWEVFANNPMLAGPCRPVPDSLYPSYWNNGTYCGSPAGTIPYPGLTNIENYALYKGSLAVSVDVTKYFRARLGVALGHEQEHFITFGDAGRSLEPYRSIDLNDEREMNPMYRPYIDAVGRRFRVAETTTFDFFISARGQF